MRNLEGRDERKASWECGFYNDGPPNFRRGLALMALILKRDQRSTTLSRLRHLLHREAQVWGIVRDRRERATSLPNRAVQDAILRTPPTLHKFE